MKIEILDAVSPSNGMDDDLDIVVNAQALYGILWEILLNDSGDPEVVLKFDFSTSSCEIIKKA